MIPASAPVAISVVGLPPDTYTVIVAGLISDWSPTAAEILLVRDHAQGSWQLPGGIVGPNGPLESVLEAAIYARVPQATIEVRRLLHAAHQDGRIFLIYLCRLVEGPQVQADGAWAYFPVTDLPASVREGVLDLLAGALDFPHRESAQ